jgi:hypothetical protein
MTINNFIYFLIFVLLTVSQSIFGQDAEDCLDENCLETLHFDSVHLNSNIPLMLKDDELEDYLGKPDSIAIENDWYCGNYIDMEESVRILYYGRTKFISSKGTSLLYVLNLEEDQFTFEFGKFRINSGDSKSELKQIFPNSLQALNNKLQSYNKEGRMKVKMLQTPEFGDSSVWFFTFTGEKIKEIELWWFIC